MRLLILDQFSDLGGGQQALLDLVPAFREHGWDMLIGLPGAGALAACLQSAGFATERIDCGPYECGRKSVRDAVRFVYEAPRLARQIRALARGADLVYINGPRLLPAASMAAIEAPVIYHAHSLLPRGVAGRLVRASLGRLKARVIANSEFVGRPLRQDASTVKVLYNGVRPQRAPSMRNGRTVSCIGRIAPEKGQLQFLAASAQIRSDLPDCRFVIHGAPLFSNSAYERKVRARAAELSVHFAGWSDDVPRVLACTDVLLVPSSPVEATTRVILEAYAAGTPVVAFANGGIPEVVEDRRTGFLADSVEQMARFAVALLRNPGMRAEISANAHECWRRRFTLEQYRRDVAAEVEKALPPAARSQPLRPAWGRSRGA